MASNAGAPEHEDADSPASPRFTIGQLFVLMLHIAEDSDALDPSRDARPPCLDCLRRQILGDREIHAQLSRAQPSVHGSALSSEAWDRWLWNNVSPGSSWMAANLPEVLPDPSLIPPALSRDRPQTTGAECDNTDTNSSDAYYSSRASSPVPSTRSNHPSAAGRPSTHSMPAAAPPTTSHRASVSAPAAPATVSTRPPPTFTTPHMSSAAAFPTPAIRPYALSSVSATRPSGMPSAVRFNNSAYVRAAPASRASTTPPTSPVIAASSPAAPAPTTPAVPPGLTAPGEAVPLQVWYVVTCGRRVGVFDNHALAVWSVTGVRGNSSRSYGSREEAERAFKDAQDMGIVTEVS
ncbi:hypothetical protein C2E23DRAFT_863877 [Lenzites betulinus]|nr:hypothetical protein C2E23DRAFT_863877 [Lenzites betulinus]